MLIPFVKKILWWPTLTVKEHYTNFHCGITGEKLKPFKENDTAKKIKGFGVNWFKVKNFKAF